MATRFYLGNLAGPTGVTPAFDGSWTRNADGARFAMQPVADGSAMVSDTFWTGSVAANATCLARQYLSDPLAAGIAFSTSDTVKCVIRAQESAANDNINRSPICIKVVAADGTTIQATLLGLGHYGPNTTEWNTSLRNKQFLDGDALTANYTTVAGDRLLIEVGGQVDATGGTTVTGTLSFGGNSASDLAENETGTAADNPWFEISRSLTFAGPPEDSADAPTGLPGGFAPLAVAGMVAASLFTAALGGAMAESDAGEGTFIPPTLEEEYWQNPVAPVQFAPSWSAVEQWRHDVQEAVPVPIVLQNPGWGLQAPTVAVAVPIPWRWDDGDAPITPAAGIVEDDAAAPFLVWPAARPAPIAWATGDAVPQLLLEEETGVGIYPAPALWPVPPPDALRDDGNATPQLWTDDEGRAVYPAPVAWAPPIQAIDLEEDWVQAPAATIGTDEDFWTNPVPPALWPVAGPIVWDDASSTPLHLFPAVDEDFWRNPVAPALWVIPPRVALALDEDWVAPPVVLWTDEDFWSLFGTPQRWQVPPVQATTDDGNDLGNLHLFPAIDEDHPAPLASPVQFAPRLFLPDPADEWVAPAPAIADDDPGLVPTRPSATSAPILPWGEPDQVVPVADDAADVWPRLAADAWLARRAAVTADEDWAPIPLRVDADPWQNPVAPALWPTPPVAAYLELGEIVGEASLARPTHRRTIADLGVSRTVASVGPSTIAAVTQLQTVAALGVSRTVAEITNQPTRIVELTG